MESGEAGKDFAWLESAVEERPCWELLAKSDWIKSERAWAEASLDPKASICRAWALAPLARLSDHESFREARLFARLRIWDETFGSEFPCSPYPGAVRRAIGSMFDAAFVKKFGKAKAFGLEVQAREKLVPLARSLGKTAPSEQELSRLSKLKAFEICAPGRGRAAELASRLLGEEAEAIAAKVFSGKPLFGKPE